MQLGSGCCKQQQTRKKLLYGNTKQTLFAVDVFECVACEVSCLPRY